MNKDATLAKLLEGWIDDTLTEEEQSALLVELDVNPDLRRRFAEQVAMLGATRAVTDAQPRWLALFDLLDRENTPKGKILSFESATMARIRASSPQKVSRRSVVTGWWAAAAAVTLLLTGAYLFRDRRVDKIVAENVTEKTPPVGIIVGASPETRLAVGEQMSPGKISQQAGWLTLEMLNGATVTFDAPFEAQLVSFDHILLQQGRARVRMAEGSKGFQLETPGFNVVDLGTEFAVNLEASDSGKCRVFEGKVEVSLLDEVATNRQPMSVSSQQSLSVEPGQQRMQLIDEQDSDYPSIKLAPREKLQLPATYESTMMAMKPTGYWRFENIPKSREVPNLVQGGHILMADGSAAIEEEAGGNHSGALMGRGRREFFQISSGKAADLLVGDFTISLFAQFESMQNFTLLSAMRYDTQVQGYSLMWQSYAPAQQDEQRKSLLHAEFVDPPSWNRGIELYGRAALLSRKWHHFAARRKSGEVTLYVDGLEVVRQFVGTMPLDCRNIFIGRLNGNDQQTDVQSFKLVGHVDELAIFTRSLSADEIGQLRAHPVTTF